MLQSLSDASIAWTEYSDVHADPDDTNVRTAAIMLRKEGHQAVLAYGGGSPIDCAKSAALSAANGADILDYLYTRAQPQRPALPIFAVTSTAGTGSEMSSAAVTTDQSESRKLGFSHPSLFPQAAIVDPALHASMPPSLTAATGLDALTHVVESYLSLAANPICDAINLEAMRRIGSSLPVAWADGSNLAARANMALASASAGMAFSQTGLGMVHGFAHPLGSRLGAAHGMANAVLLPYILAAMAGHVAPRMAQIDAALHGNADPASTYSATSLVETIVSMNKAMGIPASVAELAAVLGVDKKSLAEKRMDILADALSYRSRPRSPRTFSDSELATLYDVAVDGNLERAYRI